MSKKKSTQFKAFETRLINLIKLQQSGEIDNDVKTTTAALLPQQSSGKTDKLVEQELSVYREVLNRQIRRIGSLARSKKSPDLNSADRIELKEAAIYRELYSRQVRRVGDVYRSRRVSPTLDKGFDSGAEVQLLRLQLSQLEDELAIRTSTTSANSGNLQSEGEVLLDDYVERLSIISIDGGILRIEGAINAGDFSIEVKRGEIGVAFVFAIGSGFAANLNSSNPVNVDEKIPGGGGCGIWC